MNLVEVLKLGVLTILTKKHITRKYLKIYKLPSGTREVGSAPDVYL